MWASGESVTPPLHARQPIAESIGDEGVSELVDRHRDHERDERQDRALNLLCREAHQERRLADRPCRFTGSPTKAAANPRSRHIDGVCHPSILAGADGSPPARAAGELTTNSIRVSRALLSACASASSSRRDRLVAPSCAQRGQPLPLHHLDDVLGLQLKLVSPRDERIELGRRPGAPAPRRPDRCASRSLPVKSASRQPARPRRRLLRRHSADESSAAPPTSPPYHLRRASCDIAVDHARGHSRRKSGRTSRRARRM